MKNIKTKLIFTSLLLLLFSMNSIGQIVCADVDLVPNTGEQSDFVFDSFGKYIGGITYHGAVKINVEVDDQAPPNPDCKWMLTMSVENNPSSGSGADEWETLTTYGTGSANPAKIEILELRITNACSTSPVDGVFQNFTVDGDYYEIIENTGIRIDAGSCVTNVNGPGSFLTNYSEFSFMVDFRITPGFENDPGIYQLQVKFELVEVP